MPKGIQMRGQEVTDTTHTFSNNFPRLLKIHLQLLDTFQLFLAYIIACFAPLS